MVKVNNKDMNVGWVGTERLLDIHLANRKPPWRSILMTFHISIASGISRNDDKKLPMSKHSWVALTEFVSDTSD